MSNENVANVSEITKENIIKKIEELKNDLNYYSSSQENGKKQQIDAVSNTLNILIRTLK